MGAARLEVWRDEALTLTLAHGRWSDLLFRLPWVEDTPPLGFALFKWWTFFARTELAARVLPMALGVATVGVMMHTVRRMTGQSGWAAGLLAAFSYELLCYSQEIRVYALLVLIVTFAFLATERALQAQTARSRLVVILLTVLAAHAHAVGLLLLPMIAAYAAIRAGRRLARELLWPGIAVWLVLAAPALWFSMHWTAYHRRMGNWWNSPPTRGTAENLFNWFWGIFPLRLWASREPWRLDAWLGFWLERAVLFGTLALLALALWDARTRRIAAGLLAASCVFVIGMTVSSHVALPNIVERTMLPAWVPIVLVLGLGATAGARRIHRAMGGAATLAVAGTWAACWVWVVSAGVNRHDQSAEAFAWMKPRISANDLIFTCPHGFEDLVVYRLSDAISADQLISGESPVYGGSPPRLVMKPRAPDAGWYARLEAAVRNKEAAGVEYSIWILRKDIRPSTVVPGSPEEIVMRRHDRVESFGYGILNGAIIDRYAPRAAQPRTSAPSP